MIQTAISVIKIGHIQKETPNSALYVILWYWSAKTSTHYNFWCPRAKCGYPSYSQCHAMAGLIRTFLIDRENLHGPGIHPVWSFGTYTELQGFTKNLNVV